VDYFTANGCIAALAALDISKVFDKISHYGLYLKLMQRRSPRHFADTLKYWYSKCTVIVRWAVPSLFLFVYRLVWTLASYLLPVLLRFLVFVSEFRVIFSVMVQCGRLSLGMSEKCGIFFSKYADITWQNMRQKYVEIGRDYIFFVNQTWYVFDRIAVI